MLAIQPLSYGFDDNLFEDSSYEEPAKQHRDSCAEDDFLSDFDLSGFESASEEAPEAGMQSGGVKASDGQSGFFSKHKYKIVLGVIALVVGVKLSGPILRQLIPIEVRRQMNRVKQKDAEIKKLQNALKKSLAEQSASESNAANNIDSTFCVGCKAQVPQWAFMCPCNNGHGACYICWNGAVSHSLDDEWTAPCITCRSGLSKYDLLGATGIIENKFSELIAVAKKPGGFLHREMPSRLDPD